MATVVHDETASAYFASVRCWRVSVAQRLLRLLLRSDSKRASLVFDKSIMQDVLFNAHGPMLHTNRLRASWTGQLHTRAKHMNQPSRPP